MHSAICPPPRRSTQYCGGLTLSNTWAQSGRAPGAACARLGDIVTRLSRNFALAISKMKWLRTLTLQRNALVQDDIDKMADALNGCTCLESIGLKHNGHIQSGPTLARLLPSLHAAVKMDP